MDQSPVPFRRLKRVSTAFVVLFAVGACGSGSSPSDVDAIDRETFIATYVDLRVAALDNQDLEITDEERADVLSRHGVGGEDLRTFAEVHGTDVVFMSELWNEVESRLAGMSGGTQDP